MKNDNSNCQRSDEHILNEPESKYGFFEKSPEEKLLEDIHRPGIEKLDLFVKMLRRNQLFKKAIIIHPSQT